MPRRPVRLRRPGLGMQELRAAPLRSALLPSSARFARSARARHRSTELACFAQQTGRMTPPALKKQHCYALLRTACFYRSPGPQNFPVPPGWVFPAPQLG